MVIGLVVAGVGSALYGCAATFFTRGVTKGRRRVVVAAFLLPVLCLGWGAAVFVVQAVVNEGLLHRDLGIGDTWHAPLPNGYQILMIDVTDQGFVYNPKTQPGAGVGEAEDAVADVRTMQVAGRYILGATDSTAIEDEGQDKTKVDGYFLLDTLVGKHTTFSTFSALRERATDLNIKPDLQPIDAVYSKYRFTWFDVIAGLLVCAPPVIGTLTLITWIIRLRAAGELRLQSVET